MASIQNKNSTKYLSKLANSRVLIFGGTSGIGFCIAEAALEHGAEVIISGSQSTKLDKALNRLKAAYPDSKDRVSGHTCDLSNTAALEENIKSLFESVKSPINHIAFTAGDAIKVTPVAEATVEDIQTAGVVRFTAPLMLAKVAPAYLAPGPSSSLTLTSGTNSTKPIPGWTILAAWGAGVEGMGRGLARDLAPMRVNVVSPGSVHTELFDSIAKEKLDGVLEGFRKTTTTGRVGRPEDLAEAYLYCMKDGFVTGTVISSDGGRLLM